MCQLGSCGTCLHPDRRAGSTCMTPSGRMHPFRSAKLIYPHADGRRMSVRKISLLVRGSKFESHPRSVTTRFDDSEELRIFEYYPDVDEVFDLDSDGNFLFRTCLRMPLGTMVVDSHEAKVDRIRASDVMERIGSKIDSLTDDAEMDEAQWMGVPAFSTAEVWEGGETSSKYWIQEIVDEGTWSELLGLFRQGVSGFCDTPRTISGDDDGTFAFGVDDRYRGILASKAEKKL